VITGETMTSLILVSIRNFLTSVLLTVIDMDYNIEKIKVTDTF